MILDLKKVFSGDNEFLSFENAMDLSSTDINGYKPFVSPVRVNGTVKSKAGAVLLQADVSFEFEIPCDRCDEQISTTYSYLFEHTLVSSLNNEDNDAFIQVEDYKIDLDELLRADILLELPSKYLCVPDCKGLCTKCGINLNKNSCDCNLYQMDPRWEVLKKLID